MKAARWGRTEVVVELVKAKASLDLQNNVIHVIMTVHVHMLP